MHAPALETPRLLIRDVTASDAAAFHAYMQREEYWRDLPIERPTATSVAAMINRSLLDQSKQPRTRYFIAAIEKRSGGLIGEAILHIRSTRWKQDEIGWGVSPDHIGQGFATEIGMALLHAAFDRLDLHRVYARCRVENLASRRVMTKLGMREEGILRENVLARGCWWSSMQCSILAGER